MNLTARGLASAALAALLGGSLLVAASVQAADDVTLNLIGINDFHGRIDANTVQWAGTVDVPQGKHTLAVRATDRSGYTQTAARTDVVPDGATGWHSVQFSAG